MHDVYVVLSFHVEKLCPDEDMYQYTFNTDCATYASLEIESLILLSLTYTCIDTDTQECTVSVRNEFVWGLVETGVIQECILSLFLSVSLSHSFSLFFLLSFSLSLSLFLPLSFFLSLSHSFSLFLPPFLPISFIVLVLY